MRPIVALWAVPRSTSTAFEWMMRTRGDVECFHEPFGEVWYQGEQPLWPRLTADSIRTAGLTYESRWAEVRSAAERGRVFVKDFPHYLDPVMSDDFLGHFAHSFLIRDPAKTISSMHRKWPDFHLKETGFAEQRALFDRLAERAGEAPPVLDSDDLLRSPAAAVEAWCAAVGLPFLPASLHWDPGPRNEVSWWDGGSFHQNLRDSDGLKPQASPPVDLGRAPERVRRAYEAVVPHYEHLRRHRMTVSP